MDLQIVLASRETNPPTPKQHCEVSHKEKQDGRQPVIEGERKLNIIPELYFPNL